MPTILSTNRASIYGGPFFPEVTALRPDLTVYDRTLISAFDDQRIVEEVRKSGRRKLIIGGLWTDNCVMLPALTALRDGCEVCVLTDVCGDINQSSHDMAILRLVQAGATPVTWLAVLAFSLGGCTTIRNYCRERAALCVANGEGVHREPRGPPRSAAARHPLLHFSHRRGGRAVECGGLENR